MDSSMSVHRRLDLAHLRLRLRLLQLLHRLQLLLLPIILLLLLLRCSIPLLSPPLLRLPKSLASCTCTPP